MCGENACSADIRGANLSKVAGAGKLTKSHRPETSSVEKKILRIGLMPSLSTNMPTPARGGVLLAAVILLDWSGVDLTPKSTLYSE